MIGIYKIQSVLDKSKFYIGSSADLDRRKKQHFYSLEKNKRQCQYMQNYYNKYGKDSLEFIVLELCTVEELSILEQKYIDELKPCFNSRVEVTSNRGCLYKPRIKDLTHKRVQEIKTLCHLGYSNAEVARKYGLSRDMVNKIKAGDVWKNINIDENFNTNDILIKKIERLSKEKIEEIKTALIDYKGSKVKLAEKLNVPFYQVYSVFYRKFNSVS